ncbi:MAG: hypothetical protein ACKO43_00620, partial [Alphaproteobacteria bacterium]
MGELEEKHYFLLTKPKLDTLKSFFETNGITIDADRIGPKTINKEIMNSLKSNPEKLTPDFLRACVSFVVA